MLILNFLVEKIPRVINKDVFVRHLGVFIEQRTFVLFQMLEKVHIKWIIDFEIWMQDVHHSCVKVGLQYFTMLYKLIVLEAKHAEPTVQIVVFRRCEVSRFFFLF